VLQRVAAMASLQCPLTRQTFITLEEPMGIHHLLKLEEHVAANSPDCPHPPLKDSFFNYPIRGSSPLLLACYYGELASVERIVEHWKVDVNEAAIYYFDPFKKELVPCYLGKVTPLFAAAIKDHDDVVRYLVEKGASLFLSDETSDGEDPLKALCSR